ncbi:MAG: hypothetical protein JNM60_07685 [Candidatus Competibacteraceae bacterium]|nr:hypothetical protein [Candidatus Competibacteraceae bacterium]
MMTLRNEFRSHKQGSRRHGGQAPVPISAPPDDGATVNETCPRCQRHLTAHRFSTGDGLSIITYHCIEHGDVIPARELTARDHR